MPLSLAGVQQWGGREPGAVRVSSLLPRPAMATETAPPPVLWLKARLPSQSLQPRRMSQFQFKKHTLSGTVTGGRGTRRHVTRPLCAKESEPG